MLDTPDTAQAVLTQTPGTARFRDRVATGVVDHVTLPDGADRVAAGGFWAVVGEFEGTVRAWRFAEVRPRERTAGAEPDRWQGPSSSSWRTSLDTAAYVAGVRAVRAAVREGDVYQVNLCRVLEAPLPRDEHGAEPDALALGAVLESGNPAPYGAVVHIPCERRAPHDRPVWVVSASPELFLSVEDGVIASGPIKGTATTEDGLTAKDRAENVMIADMVRNDLQQVCEFGTVEVTDLLAVEQHPGLVHLVTRVAGILTQTPPDWPAILHATYPPASVSGAPKSSALRLISALEPTPRGPYCGTVGWIDADLGTAELAVAIRTFWWTDDGGGTLHFGTGAGITWGSDPHAEWEETELKARRLVALASGDPLVGEDPGGAPTPDAEGARRRLM